MARLKAISLFISIILVIPLTKACFPAFTTPQYYAPPPTQYYYYQQQPQVPYAASRTRLSPNNHQFSEQKDDSPVTSGGNDCLQKFENQKLICAEPIERRTETSEDECQQLCDTVQCKSFQFDSATSGCDVFHVDNQNSQPRNPFNDREQGFRHKRYNEITKTTVGHVKRIFKRAATNFDDIFRDSLRTLPNGESVTSYCSPSLVSSPGYTYTLVDEDCKLSIKEGLIHGAHDEFVGAIESFNSENGALKTPSHRNPGPVQVVIPETPDCADGNKARVQLIEGIKLIDAVAVTTVQLDNPEMCLQVCRMNAHLDGTRFSRGCKSAVFDRSNGKCSIYGEVISPNGDLNYHPDPNSVYFEKYCMNASELPISCDDVIHRIPQHTLDKRAIGTGTVVTTATQIDCIRQCITAKRRHNFECRAISYFFDWPSENCYLSRFTRIQRPDVYVPERKELVDYLEMPHCFGNTIGNSWQRDDVQHDWTEWSDCDWSLTRTRSRNCSNCDSNQERVPCISSESFNDELELLQGEHDPKPVAQTFEEAGQHVQSDIRRSEQGERSLFGDNDYSNQEEVSYFGPPYQSRHVGTPDEDDGIINPQPNIFNIHSNIKKIRPEEAHRHAGLTGNLNSNEQTKNHRTQDVNHHRQDVAQRGGHFNHQNGHEQLVDQENLHEQNSDQDHLHQQQVDQQTQEETPFLGDLKPEDLKLSGLQSAELQLFQQAQSEAEREANREIRGFKGDVDHIQFNRDDPSRLDIVKGPYSVGRLPDGGIGENGVPRGSVFDQSAPEGRAFDQRAPRGSASEQKTPEGKKSNSMVSKVPKGVPKADIFIPSGTEFTNNGAKRGLNIRKLPLNPESDGENSHKLRLEPSVNLQDQSRLHRELQSPETMYGGLQGQNSLESRLQNPKLLHDSLQNTSSHHKGLQNPSSIPTTLQNQNPSQNSLQNPISHHDALQNTEETPRTHVPTPLLESDIKGCDAHQKCCPVASGATLKGCVIGFRIGENGVKTTCLTDRCT